MSRFSNSTTISVVSPGTLSSLASLAQTMAVGTWAQLVVSNQNAILQQPDGLNNSILPQNTRANWCPSISGGGRYFDIVGQDHSASSAMRHARYTESTNLFSLIGTPDACLGAGHGFDHTAINPVTGDLYHRNYGTGISVSVKAFGQTAWGGTRYSVSSNANVATGTCLWTGTRTFGTGSNPLFLVLACCENLDIIVSSGNAGDGRIFGLDTVTKTWVYTRGGPVSQGGDGNGATPFMGTGGNGSTGNYHQIMAYSATKNVAVYGGGNYAPTRLWKMTSTGAVTEMPNCPSGKTVGVNVGSPGQGRLTVDPVTGNFLLLSAGQLWELNPDSSGTWTQKTSPPAYNQGASTGVINPDNNSWVSSVILPDHGVVGFVSQASSIGGTFYLYKNAGSVSFDFATNQSQLTSPWLQADPVNQTFVQASGGRAFGTFAASATPPPYRDSNAYLSGFGTNYEVDAVIYRNPSASFSPNREVAILLRCFQGNSRVTAFGTSAAHYYYFSWSHIGAYLILNDFLSPAELTRASSPPTPISGDRFRARIEGRRMRCWVNDVLQIDYTDNSADYSTSNPTAAGYHPTGDPGIGFFCDNGAPVTDFGFESVTVRTL